MNETIALIQFVLETSQSQPLRKRVTLYRALARICGNPAEAKQLNQLATLLNEADTNCAEFIFSFSQNAANAADKS